MLLQKESLEGAPVMSLQTGAPIAQTSQIIIDPRELKVVGFYCAGPRLDVQPAILNVSDIREMSDIGLIVDSADVLMSPDDLVRLKEVLNFNFTLDNKQVVTNSGNKVGKVITYTLDNTTLFIVKLHVRPTGLRAFKTTELLIDRTQIVQVTDDEVIVKDAKVKKKATAPVVAPVIENPFRRAPVEGASSSHADQP
jgi:sporulation protein YlmC with PRC-barrel domain